MTSINTIRVPALLMFFGMFFGCEETSETKEDFDSRGSCRDYCEKRYDCADESVSDGVIDTCVSRCRNAIEDECGDENQDEANDKLDECNNKACEEFLTCVTIETEPRCFGFIND